MALLPVYEWAGLDDDLTRRQQWAINTVGLAVAVLVADALGWVDISTAGADVLRGLPGGQQTVVGAMAIAAAYAVLFAVATRDLMDTKWVVAAAVGGFFLIDLFYIHPSELHFNNVPALFYWLAKPVWVGIPMFLAAVWLLRNTELSRRLAYTWAAVVGAVVLQLYYTVIPIPVVTGESIQVGLLGNLTVGVPIHGGALLLALAVVVVAIEGRRHVGGEA